ncbi:fimbrial assembly protein [Edwardsiella hoshinae]|uniref:Fimbrial assembly protein n=1 Tax=Edwardsiella hoshinae TaxID=93378 RepID=A0ABN4T1C1_9GAMM|nr:PefC/AfrB family outer membrane usher protein [Edwardsiella hoshinae]AOV97684.1 fimbrial assembly protein [Edwardsiella hoshinae]
MRDGIGRRGAVALAIAAALGGTGAQAGEKLDMSFIQGGTGLSPEVWDALNGKYLPGRYLVALSVNGKEAGKQVLDVTPQDSEALCLSAAWLARAGVYLNTDYFQTGYDAARQCYVLAKAPAVTVDFDVSAQSLSLAIPQKGLAKAPETVDWNYGASALRVNYNLNANSGQGSTALFGSSDLKANVGHWVVNSSATVSSGLGGGDGGGSAFSASMFTASRAIRALSADLSLGKTSTGDSLLGSSGTYGVSLSRNNSMKPGSLGYTPVFSGSANGPARVTLTQNGRLLYSELVPAGPFAITDVALYSSGDVLMTVTGEDGRVQQTQRFPLSVMSSQLSPGQHEFNLAAGVPDEGSHLRRGVVAASYGYGLNGLTLRSGGVVNPDWQGVSAGAVLGLGELGAMSADGAYAWARYRDRRLTGSKLQLGWSKQISLTGTGLRLSWSRQDKGFNDLSGFDPSQGWREATLGRRIRTEWNAGVSQPVGGLFSLSLSAWQRNYYPAGSLGCNANNTLFCQMDDEDNGAGDGSQERGLSGSLSAQVSRVSLNLGVSGARNAQGENNWSVSASVSIPFPFTLFGRPYSTSTSFNTTQGGGVGISSGVSGSLNDRVSYGLGGGRGADGSLNSYVNAAYQGDRAYLSGALNQSGNGGVSGSLSASGSVLALPAAHSVLLSRTASDTVAVVNVAGTPGVKVSSGSGVTDSDGNLVVPLNSYDWNTVTVEAGTLPLDTELGTTSQRVVPTHGAVVWMPFEVLKVQRYLLQVRTRDGRFVPGGTWARSSKGTPLGFVANNGVLMINAVDAPGAITLGHCRIAAGKLQATDKLQEITCD